MANRYSERGGQRWDDGDRRFRDRDYGDGERGFLERFADEVRSWFGDEDAQRRRMRDEREEWHGRGDSGSREWGRSDWRRGDWMRGPDEREWSRDWGYMEGRRQGAGHGSMSGGYGAWNRERDWDRETRPRRDRESTATPRDWMTGAYAGRGPRNYQRSDERIREDVCERFTADSHLDPSDVEIRVQNGDVTLDGTVNDRWAKRGAEDLAEGVWGVRSVHNLIRVLVMDPAREFRGDEQRQQDDQGRTGPQRGTWAA